MYILFIGNYLNHKDINRGVWLEIADHLQVAGHKVVTTSSKINKLQRFADMLITTWTMRRQYTIAHIDVFSGKAFLYAECCAYLLKFLKKPFAVTLHGGNLPEFARKYPARVRRLLNAAHTITFPSKYLLERMGTYNRNQCLIPNPLDIKCYPFMKRENPQPSLIWLRAFHQTYNPTLAPSVLTILDRDHENTNLIMIGPDKGDGSFKRTLDIARDLGLTAQIEFPGGVPKKDVPSWLNRGDIFLNTTNIDNTPVSVMEAMACGLCVVSTNVGGVPYLIEDEVDGLLVPPNDPEAMASAVRRILTEPGLSARLSMNARKKAERFDWSIVLPQWEQLFADLSQRVEST